MRTENLDRLLKEIYHKERNFGRVGESGNLLQIHYQSLTR